MQFSIQNFGQKRQSKRKLDRRMAVTIPEQTLTSKNNKIIQTMQIKQISPIVLQIIESKHKQIDRFPNWITAIAITIKTEVEVDVDVE